MYVFIEKDLDLKRISQIIHSLKSQHKICHLTNDLFEGSYESCVDSATASDLKGNEP